MWVLVSARVVGRAGRSKPSLAVVYHDVGSECLGHAGRGVGLHRAGYRRRQAQATAHGSQDACLPPSEMTRPDDLKYLLNQAAN